MKMKKAIFFLFVFLSYVPVLAQVDTAWVRRYNGLGDGGEFPSSLQVDAAGNVYVTGFTLGSSYDDYLTIKYASNGDTLWVRRYNGPFNNIDNSYDLAVDRDGNVYVTGRSRGVETSYDYATIKYAPNGDTIWVRHYNGPINSSDEANGIVVDDSGYVYVTGWSVDHGTLFDFVTIKYSPNGDTLWVRRYDGLLSDMPVDIKVDQAGNVYVTGTECILSLDFNCSNYATIKYAPNGDTLWVRRYDGGGNDFASELEIGPNGNVYVTGYSWTGYSFDYLTIAYSQNGDTLWLRGYNGPGDSTDEASALAVDDSGNVYVTGSSWNGTSFDYATIKYSPNGDVLWTRQYNGPGNKTDWVSAIDVDVNGDVYITGYSMGIGRYPDYATIKYTSLGDTAWITRFDREDINWYIAKALSVDDSGNVYVTGYSSDGFATIKYIQFSCIAKSGDANSDTSVLLSDIVTIINFLFKSQPAPNPLCRADANADGSVLLSDIVHLINFLFKSGPAPQKSRECCL